SSRLRMTMHLKRGRRANENSKPKPACSRPYLPLATPLVPIFSRPMQFFDGCTALITGASSGIGVEFVRQLAPHAGTLILVARRRDRLEALKGELDRPGLTVHCHAADLG